MKLKIFLLFFTLTLVTFTKDLSGLDVINQSKKNLKLNGSESIMTLIIMDKKGNKKERKLATVAKLYDKGNTLKSLMKFLSPADVKNTGFLSISYESNKDNEQWLYLPSMKKIRRIVSSEKASRFMGSEFTYADVGGIKVNDFYFKILSEIKINDINCWKIEQKPKSEDLEDDYGFLKKVLYVAKKDFIVRKSEIYNFDEDIYKVMDVNKIKKVDDKNNKYRIMDMTISNIENKRKSQMIVNKIVLKENIKDEYFSFRYLER